MMQMNVRDTVPGFDAMLRGIDLEKLMSALMGLIMLVLWRSRRNGLRHSGRQ